MTYLLNVVDCHWLWLLSLVVVMVGCGCGWLWLIVGLTMGSPGFKTTLTTSPGTIAGGTGGVPASQTATLHRPKVHVAMSSSFCESKEFSKSIDRRLNAIMLGIDDPR